MYQAVTSSYRDGHVTAWPQPQRLAQPAPGSLLRTAAQALRYRTALTGAKEPQYPDTRPRAQGRREGQLLPRSRPHGPHTYAPHTQAAATRDGTSLGAPLG